MRAPLVLACQKGYGKIAKAFLRDPGIDANAAGMAHITVGRWLDCVKNSNRHLRAAAGNGHEDVVWFLLSEPRRDGDESEALVEASKEGHVGVVKLLVKDGRAKGSWENSSCLRQAW
ncbi:hypothetical protein BJ741DRAFT_633162 [Chytriomyces cf. hyalinus JEL632]|nr:hypothetical protein BJ741DRAFT_633162 [Chytriomyces cf. hyalinus JEL632]